MRDYTFGNFLRDLREARTLSQHQLARLLHVSPQAVSKWENGTAKPKTALLPRLAETLAVTVDDLLACRDHGDPTKGANAMQTAVIRRAEAALAARYGSTPHPRVADRFYAELAELRQTDAIPYLGLLADLRAAADEAGESIRLCGVTASSFLAYLLGATDINPLPPHLHCPSCHTTTFAPNHTCGWDIPPTTCACGADMSRDGHDLPHESLRMMLRTHTMADIAATPAFFADALDRIRTALADRHPAVSPCRGSDAVTLTCAGSAPSRILLTPSEALARPVALARSTGRAPTDADLTDPAILQAICRGDTDRIPELESDFMRRMLAETNPTTFADLIHLVGLAHGSGTWHHNAADRIAAGHPITATLAYREDIFNAVRTLTRRSGIDGSGLAYQLMLDLGRGIHRDDARAQLEALGADPDLLEAMAKLRYLFPRAHGVTSVRHAMTLMWYRLHTPQAFAALR